MARDDPVVLLVGDSQVEASACGPEEMPEARLEYHLRRHIPGVTVVSLGARGWGQDQQLLVLREYFAAFGADLVLVWLSPANDVWNNLFPTHYPRNGVPKPTFWLEEGVLCGPSEQMGDPVGDAGLNLLTLLLARHLDRDGDWERRHLPAPYQPAPDCGAVAADTWQQRWDTQPAFRNEHFASEKVHCQLYLTPPSPRTRYGIALTRALLAEMRSLSAAHGAGFAVTRWRWREGGDRETVMRLNGHYYRTNPRQMRDNLAAITAGQRTIEIDLCIEQPFASATNRHLNPRAVDAYMRSLAQELAAAGVVQKRAPRKSSQTRYFR